MKREHTYSETRPGLAVDSVQEFLWIISHGEQRLGALDE